MKRTLIAESGCALGLHCIISMGSKYKRVIICVQFQVLSEVAFLSYISVACSCQLINLFMEGIRLDEIYSIQWDTKAVIHGHHLRPY